jgi:hypothetical protein
MKLKQILISASMFLACFERVQAQVTTTCPAPNPGAPNCFQTSRPSAGNPLTNWPPIPNQDCCNAIPLCKPFNQIENGVVIPPGAPAGTLFPGCVDQELPPDANTCFSNNEKGTTWYKFQIRPLGLPGFLSTPGSPAGKLRFKIIPKDVAGVPGYDQFTDNGQPSYGNTDYDFLLFKIPASASTDGAACTRIRNSPAFGTNGSVIASCNWTGTRGPTGLFEPGTGTESAQGPATRFNLPLNVNVGDIFYLAIDNFSVNDQGFDVDFRGLEAPDEFTAIVNPPPTDSIKIRKVINPECSLRTFKIIFDRPVRCDSVKPGKFTVTGLLPNLSVLSIQPEGGCNAGGQDTAFIFTLNMPPNTYDTTIQIAVTDSIRDICGNKVLLETARLRQEYPLSINLKKVINPVCASRDFKLIFKDPVRCDSVKPWKFQVRGGWVANVPGTSYAVDTIYPEGGCNAQGQDTSFIFRISIPEFVYDTTLQIRVVDNAAELYSIRDKCGNKVLPDSLKMRLEFPVPLTFKIDTVNSALRKGASCGVSKLVVRFAKKVYCDSICRPSGFSKFSVLNKGINFANVVGVKRANNQPCSVGTLDSLYEITFDRAIVDTSFQLVLKGVVRDFCQNPVILDSLPFRINPFMKLKSSKVLACAADTFNLLAQTDSTYSTILSEDSLEYKWYDVSSNLQLQNLGTYLGGTSFFQNFNKRVIFFKLLPPSSGTYTYKVVARDLRNGCLDSSTVSVTFGSNKPGKTEVCPGDPIEYSPAHLNSLSSSCNFTWYYRNYKGGDTVQRGFAFNQITPKDLFSQQKFDTLYYIYGLKTEPSSKYCRDYLLVNPKNCPIPNLVLPTTSTQENNKFFIRGVSKGEYDFKIYNRWGQLIDEGEFPVDGWNPKEKNVVPGYYYYILTPKKGGDNIVNWFHVTVN